MSTPLAVIIYRNLKKKSDLKRARESVRFFKCGKGQYGEGDRFLGVVVPDQRAIAKKHFQEASLNDIQTLLHSPFHECRLTGLFILAYRFQRADNKERTVIYRFYIKNIKAVNSWDLVDNTAPLIVGEYLCDHPTKKDILKRLVVSKNLWKRRIAILATFAFIKQGRFEETLELAFILLDDKEDLIHKAVGWMLREVGKRDKETLRVFLKENAFRMPRTMLRYAIEKFSRQERQIYLRDKTFCEIKP